MKELGSWKLQLRGNKVGNSWRLWGRREGCEQSSAVASMETRPSSIRSSRGRGAPSAIWVIEELAAEDRKAGMLPGRQQTDCLFPQQRHKGMVIPMVLFEPHNDLGGEIHPVGSQCPAMLNYLECPEYHALLPRIHYSSTRKHTFLQFLSSGATTTYLLDLA